MTSTHQYRPVSPIGFSPSRATSDTASLLLEKIREWLQAASKTNSLHGEAITELEDAFLDCRVENWDGYGACPVEDAAFIRARALLTCLLVRFPAPTATATPRGSLTLEWIVGSKRRFIVSIDGEEQIAFAGIFGSETVQGVASYVQDVPKEVVRHLQRLFYFNT